MSLLWSQPGLKHRSAPTGAHSGMGSIQPQTPLPGPPISLHPTLWLLLLPGLLLSLSPFPAAGQDPDLQRQIQESQRRLEAIREERARLQAEMEQVRTRVRDVSSELRNIEQQLSASRSVLAEVEFQAEFATSRVEETTGELLRTREEMRESKAVLYRRLRDIYKRGPLSSIRVLLGADSFVDLLNRYRYLEQIAAYDRALLDRVTQLEQALDLHNQQL